MKAAEQLRQQLFDRVLLEARLLDDGRYQDWLELFTDDGHYWIPLAPDQQDPLKHASLMYEDKLLLSMRTQRLSEARAHSQQLRSRCLHVLQPPTLESAEADQYVTRCAFSYYETRGDQQQVYGAVAWHHWVIQGDRIALKLKRIELLNCDAALPPIQLFM